MAYKQYKMKGHTLPGIKQKEDKKPSPAKMEEKPGHGTSSADSMQGGSEIAPTAPTSSGRKGSTPAKCPLVAALAPVAAQMIGGMMSKKKEG